MVDRMVLLFLESVEIEIVQGHDCIELVLYVSISRYRRGIAPVALMIGLLMEEALRASRAAIAYSYGFEFVDRKKPISGSTAPASTMLILFLNCDIKVSSVNLCITV